MTDTSAGGTQPARAGTSALVRRQEQLGSRSTTRSRTLQHMFSPAEDVQLLGWISSPCHRCSHPRNSSLALVTNGPSSNLESQSASLGPAQPVKNWPWPRRERMQRQLSHSEVLLMHRLVLLLWRVLARFLPDPSVGDLEQGHGDLIARARSHFMEGLEVTSSTSPAASRAPTAAAMGVAPPSTPPASPARTRGQDLASRILLQKCLADCHPLLGLAALAPVAESPPAWLAAVVQLGQHQKLCSCVALGPAQPVEQAVPPGPALPLEVRSPLWLRAQPPCNHRAAPPGQGRRFPLSSIWATTRLSGKQANLPKKPALESWKGPRAPRRRQRSTMTDTPAGGPQRKQNSSARIAHQGRA